MPAAQLPAFRATAPAQTQPGHCPGALRHRGEPSGSCGCSRCPRQGGCPDPGVGWSEAAASVLCPCFPTQNLPGEPEEPTPSPGTGWASRGVPGLGGKSPWWPRGQLSPGPSSPHISPDCSKPCCPFPTFPPHPGGNLYLPARGRHILPASPALQLEKNPPSLPWGCWSFLPDPEQQHHGQGQEPPALTATKRLPQAWEDGGSTGRPRQVHPGMSGGSWCSHRAALTCQNPGLPCVPVPVSPTGGNPTGSPHGYWFLGLVATMGHTPMATSPGGSDSPGSTPVTRSFGGQQPQGWCRSRLLHSPGAPGPTPVPAARTALGPRPAPVPVPPPIPGLVHARYRSSSGASTPLARYILRCQRSLPGAGLPPVPVNSRYR